MPELLAEEELQEQDDLPEPCGICLSSYLELFLKNAQLANAQEEKRVLFYRGQSDSTYPLSPSVFRKGLLPKEHILINDILLNSPAEFGGIENTLERLIKMQHYNVPTRLLDITMNPLVALYFACNGSPDTDGEVITFYDYIQRPNGLDARCIAAMAEYSGSSERQMLGFLTERGFSNPELTYLTSIAYIPIQAPLNNERIKRQQGAFILFGLHGDDGGNPFQKANFNLKPSLVREFGDDIPRSIIIPKEEKPQLLVELETFGISHGFLFPELEHQAAYIRNKHEEE